jgi:hypothetical protein
LKKAPTNGSLAKNCNNKLFIKRWYRKKTSWIGQYGTNSKF